MALERGNVSNDDTKYRNVYGDIKAQHEAREKAWQNADLAAMSEKKLAEWHSLQEPNSRGAVLAEHEWQRRLTERHIRASRWLAVIGIVASLAGVVLGWWLSSLRFHG